MDKITGYLPRYVQVNGRWVDRQWYAEELKAREQQALACDTSLVTTQIDMIVEEVKVLEQKHQEAMLMLKTMTNYLDGLRRNDVAPGSAAQGMIDQARKMLLNT